MSPQGRYYEPFLGGGAVFFCLRPSKAVLSDINVEVTNAYLVVRDTPAALVAEVRKMRVTRAEYYHVRQRRPRTPLTCAARFLYLNRTAFGGIYRLNRWGAFNVPYGGGDRTPSALWEQGLVVAAAGALAGARIMQSDFEPILNRAMAGDVVYCDPTYTVAHDNNGFVRYNERNFSWRDQERLAMASASAAQRGATVVVSNAHHPSIRKLYPSARFVTLMRHSRVSPDPIKRRFIQEYLLVLHGGNHAVSARRVTRSAPSRSKLQGGG